MGLLGSFKDAAAAIKRAVLYGYKGERALIRRYLGVELAREQYDQYKDQFHLREVMGSDEEIHRLYYGFGTSVEVSAGQVIATILTRLDSAGVHFSLEGKDNSLRRRLEIYTNTCNAQGHSPSLPKRYANHESLVIIRQQWAEARAAKQASMRSEIS